MKFIVIKTHKILSEIQARKMDKILFHNQTLKILLNRARKTETNTAKINSTKEFK